MPFTLPRAPAATARPSTRVRRLTVAAIGAAAVVLAACGGDDPASSAPVTGNEVRVVDNDFEPANLEVEVSDAVTWTWEGRAPHDVVGDGFDSGIQDEGTFIHTFDEAGTYTYECTLHRGMTGAVTVVGP